MDTRNKIVTFSQLESTLRSTRQQERPVIAKGRFELLQVEHCRRLSEAKKRGAPLIVFVSANRKPPKSPLDERARAELVAALAAVDYVIICDEAEADGLVSSLNPKIVIDTEQPPPRDIIADVLQRQDSA